MAKLINVTYLLIKIALPFFFLLDNWIIFSALKNSKRQNNSYFSFHQKYGIAKISIIKFVVFIFVFYFLFFDLPLNISDMGYVLIVYYIYIARIFLSLRRKELP